MTDTCTKMIICEMNSPFQVSLDMRTHSVIQYSCNSSIPTKSGFCFRHGDYGLKTSQRNL